MRLQSISLISRDCNGTATLLLPGVERPVPRVVANTHKISEKSMLEPERCGYRSLGECVLKKGREKDGRCEMGWRRAVLVICWGCVELRLS
jgi:hypothetical protein